MEHESTKRLSPEARRDQIIQSALHVFIEHGFVATTTAEIAKAAGISEVTLFRHFSSKRDIFFAGIEPILLNPFEKNMSQIEGNIDKIKIQQIIFNRIKFLEENRGIVKLILNESILSPEGEGYIHKMVINLKSSIDQAGVLGDDEFIIRLLMGSFLSFLYQPDKNEKRLKDYVHRISEIIFERLKENNR